MAISQSTPTNTSVTVGSTTTTVRAGDGGRTLLILSNDGTETMYLAFGAAAVLNKGLPLPVGASFVLSPDGPAGAMITKTVNGISTTGSQTLCIVEVTN